VRVEIEFPRCDAPKIYGRARALRLPRRREQAAPPAP
jgi:hypothetical protein